MTLQLRSSCAPVSEPPTVSLPRQLVTALGAVVMLIASGSTVEALQAGGVQRNMLLEGRLDYVIVESGEEVGSTVLEAGFSGGTYFIRDVSTMGADIQEEAVFRFDGDTLEPRTADIFARFGAAEVRTHQAFDEQRVGGYALSRGTANDPWRESAIDAAVPAEATFRGAVIWMAQARGLSPGDEVETPWFSTLSGMVEAVTLVATGRETVTVPAGTFDTVRIEQRGGTPGNVLFVTTQSPYRIVRVEVVGRPMTIDLISL